MAKLEEEATKSAGKRYASPTRQQRYEQHKCITCGADLPENCMRVVCDKCHKRNNDYYRDYRRRKNGNV